mgnify:FL=1
MLELEQRLKDFLKEHQINNVGDILTLATHPRDMVDILNIIIEEIGFNNE